MPSGGPSQILWSVNQEFVRATKFARDLILELQEFPAASRMSISRLSDLLSGCFFSLRFS